MSTANPARDHEDGLLDIVDPHGASDPVTPDEFVGRRRGLRGLWSSLAYWVQLAGLSLYGPASQPRASDPIERLKKKYGRPARKY